ncbi:MAG: phytanoyl-CoA dioxygenase family protein [Pyrinomonadaceae bacterium]
MDERRYTQAEIDQLVAEAIKDGFCILRAQFAREKLTAWYDQFLPLLEDHIEREGEIMNRGPGRFYVTLPFDQPFADESIFADPVILAIVKRLVGSDFTMVQLASDTPVAGSDYQDIHRDAPPLFPEIREETPAFQLAVNFPLVDVTLENGPFEVARGTHMMTKEDGLRAIGSGERPLEPVCLGLGDVMIRDVRGLHRGTPNRKGDPRPMIVIGYSRRWLFRPEVSIRVPGGVWAALSPASRHMLRFNEVVESLEDAPKREIYQSFAY